MNYCECPAKAALTTIPAVKCGESMGQVQRIAFQRIYKADGTKNGFHPGKAAEGETPEVPGLPITEKASWDKLLAAADDTKIVLSPIVQAPESEPGDARTYGGGNDTPGGVEEVLGANPTSFSGVFRSVPQSVIAILKELQCEARGSNLGVYLFDENGAIEAVRDAAADGTYHPIPIRSLFVSDKGHGGFEAPDYNNITWQFPPNFSDSLAVVKPEFNPVDDLAATE